MVRIDVYQQLANTIELTTKIIYLVAAIVALEHELKK